MHVFIDESGSFGGFHAGSIAAVGALAIPDCKLPQVERLFARLRRRLPLERGEVKGKLLNERQVCEIVSILRRNEAVFEVCVVDIGAHTKSGVEEYKASLLVEMWRRIPRFNEHAQKELAGALRQLEAMPVNLFIQAVATFNLLHNVMSLVPMYFAQRRPIELGHFLWVFDGKDPARITNWEQWLAYYALGALATRSQSQPGMALDGADYSYFERSYGANSDEEGGIDLSLLLSDIQFSSGVTCGLELVDVLTNGIRRALTGTLGRSGWIDIRKVMIHRNEQYISLVVLEGAGSAPSNPPYADVVRAFRSEGKTMLIPSVLTDS